MARFAPTSTPEIPATPNGNRKSATQPSATAGLSGFSAPVVTTRALMVTPMSAPSWSGLDRRIGPAAPFGPGAVVYRGVSVAEQLQSQDQSASAGSGAAGGNDRLRKVNPGSLQAPAERAERKDRAVRADQLGIGKVDAARYVARSN